MSGIRCSLALGTWSQLPADPPPPKAFKFFVQFTFYAALYCALALAVCAYIVSRQLNESGSADGAVCTVLGLAAFFGLFSGTMTATSMRYVCLNLTNVEALTSRQLIHQLAVRVPSGTQSCPDFNVIDYPLPRPGEDDVGGAKRTFAIVPSRAGENPWDRGLYYNWVSVMGTTVLDWLLPIRSSPCIGDENGESFYRFGWVLLAVRRRCNVPPLPAAELDPGSDPLLHGYPLPSNPAVVDTASETTVPSSSAAASQVSLETAATELTD